MSGWPCPNTMKNVTLFDLGAMLVAEIKVKPEKGREVSKTSCITLGVSLCGESLWARMDYVHVNRGSGQHSQSPHDTPVVMPKVDRTWEAPSS